MGGKPSGKPLPINATWGNYPTYDKAPKGATDI
jgi:hypothetical protein